MRGTTRLLLDVNVWTALMDDAHVHNAEALALFQKPKLKIATCPLVENGVLRVLNLPGYSQHGPAGFEAVRAKMAVACADVDHEFWADDKFAYRWPGELESRIRARPDHRLVLAGAGHSTPSCVGHV